MSSKRSYISTRPFHSYIFRYSTSISVVDFETVGTLTQVDGANALNCPQGRILRETGRKLYPGTNPGVTEYMVSVYDTVTGFNGFINPNSIAFTPQNTDRPYFIQNSDRAPPVFTTGDVLAEGNMDLSGAAQIVGNLTINGSLRLPNNCGVANMASGVSSGGFKRLNITSSSFNSNTSLVFLTNRNQVSAGSAYSAEPTGLNSFNIVSNNASDTSQINYMIIN